MLRLPDESLPRTAQNWLSRWQADINQITDYVNRVQAAKANWKSRNITSNRTFQEVRKTLASMCPGARRCAYCEDSFADEIEHIRPKDLYPEAVFCWENYLYACGPCNGPKSNKFAVFVGDDTTPTDVSRCRNGPIVPPTPGAPVLINPRAEDPLEFMTMDIQDTFFVLSIAALTGRKKARSEYTIQVLRLNDRDALVLARREAFVSYRARLVEYRQLRDDGASTGKLANRTSQILNMQHPFVWAVMKRQHQNIHELNQLFSDVPEALEW